MNIDIALRYAAALVFATEGFASAAYLDELCHPPRWTIGHGTTRIDNVPVQPGMVCTRAEADDWSISDMRAAALAVIGCVSVPLNTWQLGALTSFTYNVGAGRFLESSVREALNKGLYRIAADRLLEYDEAHGVVERGLQTRRARERALFLSEPPPIIASPSTDQLNQAELDKLDGQTSPPS